MPSVHHVYAHTNYNRQNIYKSKPNTPGPSTCVEISGCVQCQAPSPEAERGAGACMHDLGCARPAHLLMAQWTDDD